MDDIFQNPHNPWYFGYVSINPNITMKDVLDHPEIKWNWNCLSMNPGITIDDVLQNPDKPWNDMFIIYNPNVTLEYIRKCYHIHLLWENLSQNKFKYDTNLNLIHIKRVKYVRQKCKIYKNYFLIKHPSQKFYKWYCGEEGIGRKIDNERQMRLKMK